jgi:uncharacterized membrane protein
MTKYLIAYGAAVAVLAVLDAIWLGVVARDFYREQIGHLMASDVRMGVAVGFYLVYLAGVVIFAVVPALDAGSFARAVGMGALFGFFAYMTYDMTNLATLRDWPVKVAVVDVLWGTFVSAAAAGGAYWAARTWGS